MNALSRTLSRTLSQETFCPHEDCWDNYLFKACWDQNVAIAIRALANKTVAVFKEISDDYLLTSRIFNTFQEVKKCEGDFVLEEYQKYTQLLLKNEHAEGRWIAVVKCSFLANADPYPCVLKASPPPEDITVPVETKSQCEQCEQCDQHQEKPEEKLPEPEWMKLLGMSKFQPIKGSPLSLQATQYLRTLQTNFLMLDIVDPDFNEYVAAPQHDSPYGWAKHVYDRLPLNITCNLSFRLFCFLFPHAKEHEAFDLQDLQDLQEPLLLASYHFKRAPAAGPSTLPHSEPVAKKRKF